MKLFDAHNHLQDARLGDIVIPAMRSAGISMCVVNATREDDWSAVEQLAQAHPDFVLPAFGIHPWHAHTARPGWVERLAGLLTRYPQASIGECGVDRWIETPDSSAQLPVFTAQIRLARELDRPLTIHCLKAWGLLESAFASEAPPPRFLLHSFNGSLETAQRWLPLGAHFSFSGHFLHPRKKRVVDVFTRLPADRVLLETDAPDMPPPTDIIDHALTDGANHPANLRAIATAAAGLFQCTPDELAARATANARRLFRSSS